VGVLGWGGFLGGGGVFVWGFFFVVCLGVFYWDGGAPRKASAETLLQRG